MRNRVLRVRRHGMLLIGILYGLSGGVVAADDQGSDSKPPKIGERDLPGALEGVESNEQQLDEIDDPGTPVAEPKPEEKFREKWQKFKDRTDENHGLRFGFNYALVFQAASESLGADQAGGGRFQVLAKWTPLWRDTGHPGTFALKIENRHRLSGVSLQQFNSELGVAGPTAFSYSDFGWGVLELNYKQMFFDQRFAVQFGEIQPITYLDVYPLVSPMSAFLNQSFSFNPTIAIPASGLGVVAAGQIWRQAYFITSISDGNAQNSQFGLDTFFDYGEFFKHIELGWAINDKKWKDDNVHLTLWHVDDRTFLGRPEGWGLAFSYAQHFGSWMPYLRAGYSEDGGVHFERMVSAGFGYQLSGNKGLLGFGSSWGRTPRPDPQDQYTMELFWRTQITPSFEITPDLQFVFDPAYNSDADVIVIAGIRGRFKF